MLISSACPTVVEYLQKHRPEQSQHLTHLLSPLLTHCKMLRQSFGPDIAIVFIGPCIGKKLEADVHPELLEVALTFEDLRAWFVGERIRAEDCIEGPDDRFVPEHATDGAMYPVDGGMIAGVKANCRVADCGSMAFSGLSSVKKALVGLEQMKVEQNVLVELLACEGGCVNGPKAGCRASTIEKRHRILAGTPPGDTPPRPPGLDIHTDLRAAPLAASGFSDSQIRQALRTVGKSNVDDELNCGGCGYDSCREFGSALLGQKAERAMCVTYMRQLAHKKANALIQKMPSAVVIVDAALKVLECNRAFVQLFAPADKAALDAPDHLAGRDLADLIGFARYFGNVLKTGEDLVDKDLRPRAGDGGAILHLSIFTIEPHLVVGGIIQDITKPAVQKEQVIKKAQEVNQRNLATVQKIAYLLGENAAESEITLNSIIDSFSPPKPEKPEEPGSDHDWRKRYRR